MATEAKQDVIISVLTTQYQTLIDKASITVTYVGYALPGTATSSALWRIIKIDKTSGTKVTFADSVTSYTKVWDNRATYNYSI